MTFTIAVVVLVAVSFLAGNAGSMSSIQRHWHAQHIYHRCIMPSVSHVCLPPQALGIGLSVGLYWLLTGLLQLNAWVAVSVSAALCAGISFAWARSRGKRIYAQNVQMLGNEAVDP